MPETRINTGFRHFNPLFKLGKAATYIKLFCLVLVANSPVIYLFCIFYFGLLIFCCQNVAKARALLSVFNNYILIPFLFFPIHYSGSNAIMNTSSQYNSSRFNNLYTFSFLYFTKFQIISKRYNSPLSL